MAKLQILRHSSFSCYRTVQRPFSTGASANEGNEDGVEVATGSTTLSETSGPLNLTFLICNALSRTLFVKRLTTSNVRARTTVGITGNDARRLSAHLLTSIIVNKERICSHAVHLDDLS